MKIAVIITPHHGETETAIAYAEAALFDSLMRREAPFASHLLYPRVLDESNEAHCEADRLATHEIILRSDYAVVYMDHGISGRMKTLIEFCRHNRLSLVQRWLSRYTPTTGSGDDVPLED